MGQQARKTTDLTEHHVVQTPDHEHEIEALESYSDVDSLNDIGEYQDREEASHILEHEDDGDDESYLDAMLVREDEALVDMIDDR